MTTSAVPAPTSFANCVSSPKVRNDRLAPSDVAAHIHPHPTLSEGVGEAMLALAGRALHTP